MGFEMSARKLSQLEIDADLVMGAHNITLGVGQTVDSKDVSGLIADTVGSIEGDNMVKVVSDNLRHSDDAIASVLGTTYTKRGTITFTNGIKGTLRIKVDIYTSAAGGARAIMTQDGATPNGSNIGVEQSEADTAFHTHSQDIAVDIPVGESIDLWLKNSVAGKTTYARNWRFYYDNEIAAAVTGAD